jgi:hypothetical protein
VTSECVRTTSTVSSRCKKTERTRIECREPMEDRSELNLRPHASGRLPVILCEHCLLANGFYEKSHRSGHTGDTRYDERSHIRYEREKLSSHILGPRLEKPDLFPSRRDFASAPIFQSHAAVLLLHIYISPPRHITYSSTCLWLTAITTQIACTPPKTKLSTSPRETPRSS